MNGWLIIIGILVFCLVFFFGFTTWCFVDWKHNWKKFIKECFVWYLITFLITPINENLSQMITENGFSNEVMMQWTMLSLIFWYISLPFVGIRSSSL